MRRILLALGALIAALAAAAPAQAGRTQESIFQDDRVLLDPSQREAALDTLQSAGVDTIHSLVFWHKVAPAADSDRKPAGFNAASPAAYPAANWDPYDDLVRGAGARGMQVLFSPNGFTPEWASSCETARYRNCRPNAREFGRFVQAVGRRYSGRYRDENQGGGTLPKVSRWSIWNEPNQLGWIYPQVSRGRFVGVQIYRNLVNEGIRALRRTGHRRSKIYLGETAPLGDRRGRFPAPCGSTRSCSAWTAPAAPTAARPRAAAAAAASGGSTCRA